MPERTMQAIRFYEYGGPQVLVLERVPVPQPGEDQVLVRLVASGVNPADWKLREGYMKNYRPLPLPWIPGIEGAGEVEELGQGPGAADFERGQPVYGAFPNTYAEYAVVPAANLQPKPEKLSYDQAASVPVGALTAWGAIIDAANVQAGQRVLVQGAAGGVGMYAVQLARWKGAHVIGTASRGNIDFIRSIGVEQAVDYTATPFENVVQDVDVVLDTVGGDLPERSVKVMRPGGVLMSVAARPTPEFGQAHGVQVKGVMRAPEAALAQISQLIEEGKLRPEVGRVYSLAEARQAQEQSQAGHGRGRIILHIAED